MTYGTDTFATKIYATTQAVAIDTVGRNLSINWDINVTVGRDLGISWDINSGLGKSLAVTWDVKNGITKDLTVSWNILNKVTKDLEVSWYVQGSLDPKVKGNSFCVPNENRKKPFCL